jgi:integrase
LARGSVDRIVSDRTGNVSYRARWEFVDEQGRRRHRSKCFPTKKAAQDQIAKVQHELRAGSYVEASHELTADFAARYLRMKRHHWRRPSTYERMARCWMKMGEPALGRLPLNKLTTGRIQAVYDDLLSHGKINSAKSRTNIPMGKIDRTQSSHGYSASAVLLLHTFLCGLLDTAVREGMLATNPAKGATLPKRTRHVPVTWNRTQVQTFLKAVNARDDAVLWSVFVHTGLRIGEIIALRWDAVDLERGTLTVRRTATRDHDGKRVILEGAKTKSSNRQVVLLKPCLAALKWHRQITSGTDWVFPGPSGEPMSDPAIRSRLATILSETGLSRLTPHGFRHTAATMALAAGIHPKLVQEMLGHKSITMTLDLYSHVDEGMRRSAAEQLDEYLQQQQASN